MFTTPDQDALHACLLRRSAKLARIYRGGKQQLEDLRDSTEHKDALVRYLSLHSVNASWIDLFKHAFRRYISSKTNVAIFGLLIRDVTPKPEDLSARIESEMKNGQL
jgi:hypothetical protein